MGAEGVIAAVNASSGDLGMFAVDSGPKAGAWWLRLVGPTAPKVIARLPFVERADHPAGMPVVVVSKPLADGAARDVVLEAVHVDRWRGEFTQVLAQIGAEVMGSAAEGAGLSVLLARPGSLAEGAGAKALATVGAADVKSYEVGSHAQRFEAVAG